MYQWKREYKVDPINCMSIKGIKMGEINGWKQNLPKTKKGGSENGRAKYCHRPLRGIAGTVQSCYSKCILY